MRDFLVQIWEIQCGSNPNAKIYQGKLLWCALEKSDEWYVAAEIAKNKYFKNLNPIFNDKERIENRISHIIFQKEEHTQKYYYFSCQEKKDIRGAYNTGKIHSRRYELTDVVECFFYIKNFNHEAFQTIESYKKDFYEIKLML